MRWIVHILVIRYWSLAFILINTSVQTKFIAITQKYFDEKGFYARRSNWQVSLWKEYDYRYLIYLVRLYIKQIKWIKDPIYKGWFNFSVYMCLSSFWNFGAICKMVSKKTILLETPGQSWEGRLNWKFPTIKTKLIYLIH